MFFFIDHLLEMWHHLMLTCGTIGMFPCGNIILPPDNILVVPHDNIPMVPHVNIILPPDNIPIMYMSLDPIPRGGIQMP
jgi:hypothetical protein